MLHIAHHPLYKHSLPLGHRFPMGKYELLPQQLLLEGTCTSDNFFEPTTIADHHVLACHTQTYFDDLKNLTLNPRAARKLGFPLSKTLVQRELVITDGTLKCCDYALEYRIAMNIAGGTHHAYSDHGEAFCLLNDQAIAARYLLNTGLAHKILIVDLDVHHGNGTAQIFQNDPNVFTFSMHGKANYPFRKEQSDLDIALETGTNDAVFLKTLKETLPRLIDDVQPDFIFYLSGVDILESDKLGKLGCSLEGCAARDRYVLQTCKDYQIPVQCSMGGGYSPEIKTIIEAHANTFRQAQEIYF